MCRGPQRFVRAETLVRDGGLAAAGLVLALPSTFLSAATLIGLAAREAKAPFAKKVPLTLCVPGFVHEVRSEKRASGS